MSQGTLVNIISTTDSSAVATHRYMMVITHFDCRLCCTILISTEMISAITAAANNADKITITTLLSLKLSPSEQLEVTTENSNSSR